MRTRIIGLLAVLAAILILTLGQAAHADPVIHDPLVRPPGPDRPQRQHPPGDLQERAHLVRLPRPGLRHLASLTLRRREPHGPTGPVTSGRGDRSPNGPPRPAPDHPARIPYKGPALVSLRGPCRPVVSPLTASQEDRGDVL